MIRLSTSVNPLGLELGERIKAKRICEVAYDENNERRLFFTPEHENDPWVNDGKMKMTPVSCIVIGVAKKALGTYCKGQNTGGVWDLECDYDPPRLDVTKYVRLYECRESIDKPAFFVHPDDVVFEERSDG